MGKSRRAGIIHRDTISAASDASFRSSYGKASGQSSADLSGSQSYSSKRFMSNKNNNTPDSPQATSRKYSSRKRNQLTYEQHKDKEQYVADEVSVGVYLCMCTLYVSVYACYIMFRVINQLVVIPTGECISECCHAKPTRCTERRFTIHIYDRTASKT